MSKKKHKKDKGEGKQHAKAAESGGLPSMLREAGAMLLAKADTPEGREVIASGLAMAAAAATAAAARARNGTQASDAKTAQPAATEASQDEQAAGKAADPHTPPVMEALSAAASVFMSRLMERKA